jgi:aminopeptidase
MSDPRVDKLAEVLVDYSTAVRPGDDVVISGGTPAEPLLKAVYARVLQAGGHPILLPSLPGTESLLYRLGSDEQLQYVPEPVKLMMETYDVRISIRGAANTKALSNVDPSKVVLRSRAQTELMKTFMQRSASGSLRWVSTLFPTNAYAQDAQMSLSEYEDFVYGACMPDLDDPVGYWEELSAWQQKIVNWLAGKERVHVVGPGTDLELSIAGRTFINSDGKNNMPSGEVFTGPVEDSVSGHVTFSYPAIHQGREVTGIRLRFEEGQVVEASAKKNEVFLLQTLDTDEGSRYVGEFAIGTNEGITLFTSQILFDEKINGSFHMALGAGYPSTGSRNESAIHWDMICDLRDGGRIWVDDELLYENGKFVVGF